MMLSLALGLALTQTTDADVVKWFKEGSIPLKTVEAGNGLEDMEPLREILKDVQVVGMGESTHGSREIFQMKHRMFEFLVTKLDYKIFALEASLPDCIAMDRYVTTGEGDPAEAVKKQNFWTWSTEEVLDLIKWMRAYNEKNGPVLRVVGVDMQSQEMAVVYLEKAFKKYGIDDSLFMEEISWEPLTEAEKAKLKTMLEEVKKKASEEEDVILDRVAVVVQQASDLKRANMVTDLGRKAQPSIMKVAATIDETLKTSPDADADTKAALELLSVAFKKGVPTPEGGGATLKKYAKAVRAYAASRKLKQEDYEEIALVLEFFATAEDNKDVWADNFRDRCMADNLEWAIKTYLPGQKVMYWAHNYHVSNQRYPGRLDATGSHLTERLKDKYYPVGFSFYNGSFQARSKDGKLEEWTVPAPPAGSLDATMHRSGRPMFFANFASAPDPVKAWLKADHITRSVGAMYNPDLAHLYLQPQSPSALYRGMIFIAKTTRARPLK